MNIGKKYSLWTLFFIALIGLIAAYTFYRHEIDEETKIFIATGSRLGAVLEHSLDNYMITRNFNAIDKTLYDLGKVDSIKNIRLIDRERVIRSATDKREVGNKMSPEDMGCHGCHDKGQGGFFFRKDDVFRWVQHIKNKPECFGCHSPGVKNNGVFLIDFPISELLGQIKKDVINGFLIFFSFLIAIGLFMIVLSRTLVIKRLENITEGIKSFKEGDYNVRIPSEGTDEITKLADVFNEMSETINTRDREKDELFMKVSRSQKEWRETFDSITDMIALLDIDFRIRRANRAFSGYFGLQPQDVIGKKCYELFHKTDSPLKGCPFEVLLREERTVTQEIFDPKSNRVFLVSVYPYYSPEGGLQGSIHVSRDISEEKEKEVRFIMSEKLASLGQMASGIAHEINNPLAAIAGCAEGLLSRVQKGHFEPELFENYLKIIEEEISRCKSITTGILSFARRTTHEKKKLQINEILDKTLEIIGFQGRLREVKIIKNYTSEAPVIEGNEGELRQVFMIIITNALDTMEDKGSLTLETGVIPPSPPFTKGGQEGITKKGGEGGFVFIKISDTGQGIPSDYISKIFDPFFTTKSEKGGTGLGLSIARKIINNHNGNIDVISEERKGTTFNITLPI